MVMTTKMKVVTGVASAAVTGLLVVGGASFASAADDPGASTGASTSQDQGRRGGGTHTPVTGDEATGVIAAVTAKDSAVTASEVQKDEDGSYDVKGTKDGADVFFDVSADLATVTERTGGGRGGHGGGQGGGTHTPVTGDEATKVIAAVTAKDSTVTASEVQKDEDGSYDVQGTKDGADVFFDVSADLATVTERTGGGRGGHRGDDGSGAPTDSTQGATGAQESSASA